MSIHRNDDAPTRHLRPNDMYAYTITRPEHAAELPFYYLLGLSQALGVLNPVALYAVFPQDFRPVSII